MSQEGSPFKKPFRVLRKRKRSFRPTEAFAFVRTRRNSSSSRKDYEDECENPLTDPLEINENDLNTLVIDQSTLSTTTIIQEEEEEKEGDGQIQEQEEQEQEQEEAGGETESTVDESQVKRYGTLVIWEGNSNEPIFEKAAVKKGNKKFYIVNCGEAKSSSYPGRCHKSIDPHHHYQQHLAGGNSACNCCGGGCPTYNNTHYDPECTKRVNRRRPKGPKKVQLVTKEEHHKILNSFIEEKKYEPDFKVDSLFAPRDPRDDHNNHSNNNNPNNQQMTETAPTRRTRLQNRMAPKANKHHHHQHHHHHHNQQDEHQHQHQIIENKQVVSFTVLGNEELIDDVAGYEMVESNMSNDSDQSRDDQNPEFGIHLNSEDEIPSSSTGEQRPKRQYRARKPTNKGQQQCLQHLDGNPNPNSDFGEIPGEIMCDLTGKPRCTYTDLIEKALQQSVNGLTVSEIYNWISSNYPYFQVNDDRWKNSVRHNLSINPYFKKGDKASNGAGHLWVIAEEGKGIRPPMRRRSGSDNIMDIYDQGDMIPIRNETDRAISVILSEYAVASMQHNQQQQQQHQQQQQQNVLSTVDQQVQIGEESLHEQPPVTYIQIPNEIAIGNCTDNENCQQSQVICYENLPDGSYAIDLHTSNTQMNPDENDMYTLTDFTDGNVIMVNIEDSSNTKHEEQMTERLELDDVFVSDFSVLNTDGNDLMNGMTSSITNWL